MRRTLPWLTLTLIALFAGAYWRWEVEAGGWAGLTWTGLHYRSVPVSLALFIAWATFWVELPSHTRRALVAVALAVFAYFAPGLVRMCLGSLLAYGVMLPNEAGPVAMVYDLVLGWWLFTPALIAGLLRLCGARPGWRRVLASQALFLASLGIATLALELAPQHGEHDLIHAFKSGFVIPLFVLSLGLVVPVRRSSQQVECRSIATDAPSPTSAL